MDEQNTIHVPKSNDSRVMKESIRNYLKVFLPEVPSLQNCLCYRKRQSKLMNVGSMYNILQGGSHNDHRITDTCFAYIIRSMKRCLRGNSMVNSMLGSRYYSNFFKNTGSLITQSVKGENQNVPSRYTTIMSDYNKSKSRSDVHSSNFNDELQETRYRSLPTLLYDLFIHTKTEEQRGSDSDSFTKASHLLKHSSIENISYEPSVTLGRGQSNSIRRKAASLPNLMLYQDRDSFVKSTEPLYRLCDKDYESFRNKLLRQGIPNFLLSTYLDYELNKICVDVKEGKLHVAKCYFTLFHEKLFEFLDFEEADDFQLGGPLLLAADFDSEDSTDDPGDNLSHVQSGSKLFVTTCDQVRAEDNEDIMHTCSSSGTLGLFVQDQNEVIYGITAKHVLDKLYGFCRGVNVHTLTNVKTVDNKNNVHHIGDAYYGAYPPMKETKRKGNSETVSLKFERLCAPTSSETVDIAAIPVKSTLLSSDKVSKFFRNDNGKDVRLSLFEGNSNKLIGKSVQAQAAKSGLVKGTIVRTSTDCYSDGSWLGKDCFVVLRDSDKPMAKVGDSGSLFTDILSDKEMAYAYGILFLIQRKYKDRRPGENRESKTVAWGVRLDNSLKAFDFKWNLKMNLINKNNKQAIYPEVGSVLVYQRQSGDIRCENARVRNGRKQTTSMSQVEGIEKDFSQQSNQVVTDNEVHNSNEITGTTNPKTNPELGEPKTPVQIEKWSKSDFEMMSHPKVLHIEVHTDGIMVSCS